MSCQNCHQPPANCHCHSQTLFSEYQPTQALVNIYEQNCNTSCQAVDGCPDTLGKLYGLTVPNTSITIPAVGSSFSFVICVSNQVTVGQWVYIKDIGKYPVLSLTGGGRTVTVRNSCSDGTAIIGNAAPGFNKVAQHEFYTVAPADCDSAACTRVANCISGFNAETRPCMDELPELTDSQQAYSLGLLAACDAMGNCTPSEDSLCWVFNPWHRYKKGTIEFLEGMTVLSSDDLEGGNCASPVVVLPNGQLRSGGGLSYYINRKLIKAISVDSNIGALIAAYNFEVDLTPFIPTQHLPCIKAVAVSGYYTYEGDSSDGDGLNILTYIRSTSEPANSADLMIQEIRNHGTAGTYRSISAAFAKASVAVNTTTKKIAHDLQNIGTSGGSNRIDMRMFIDGYWI